MERRDFLKAMALASGAFLASPILGYGKGEYPVNPKPNNYHKVPLLPWGYVELDPQEAFKRGHLGYFIGECAAGAFWAITSLLREKKGYPYTYLPIPSLELALKAAKAHKHLPMPMRYGNGGIEGYATVCGALNGASAAIEYAVGPKASKQIIRRLFRWYETTAFPTEEANEWAEKHKFYDHGKTDKALPSIVAHSVLCHVVVSKWCKETGYASGSKERSERCARITAAVAKHAVELLNAYAKGKLDELYPFKLDEKTQTCRACHHKGKDYKHGQFSRGFMECSSCHNVNLKDHMKEVMSKMK